MNDLAPFACDPQASRGRIFAASISATRSEYQRDRDRIIHSSAFRRLQHKTQVFLHHEGQHFRTRLTHTLEVSQIARSLARALDLNEDLAEAIALAHDLGHPPFGHAGERALNGAMAEWGGFDHNLQALRTVCMLENRYAGHDGMNLTWETLEGLLKHNGPLPGMPDLSFLPAGLDLEIKTHASLEAQVAAIADDIAYDAHDIDDAVRAKMIELGQLGQIPLLGSIIDAIAGDWPNLEQARQTHEVQRRLITAMIENVIISSKAKLEKLAPGNVDDIRHAGQTLVGFSPSMQGDEILLKKFLYENVYRAPAVMRPVNAAQKLVGDLFERYFATGDMPGQWGEKVQKAANEHTRARIIADFIAGMTDPYAIKQYQRLFDATPDLS
ncbi:dNTP triphosphohydrolase, broad substrate specificity [hydrothermal vent metagenome]|uniref:DNTP triphosphohydrolase, broad substrate specificity n=1 Tax=hydrothermal vent metagenome TaxID=652676 RepID=A0A3B0U3P8_9ZZZZ